MRRRWLIVTGMLSVVLLTASVGCKTQFVSAFTAQAVKPTDLINVKYRVLKTAAVGKDTGFKLLWIPFASPSEADAKADMMERLTMEGISTAGKNIAFTNATSDRGGFGFIGIIGAPSIKLTADIIELLGDAPVPAAPSSN
jgi:hypothetical protein